MSGANGTGGAGFLGGWKLWAAVAALLALCGLAWWVLMWATARAPAPPPVHDPRKKP